MSHSTPTYYEDHRRQQLEELPIDDEEEYSEDQFLRQHYGRPRLGGLDLVQDDSDADDDDYNTGNHVQRKRFDDDDDDDDSDDDDEEIEDEDDDYDEVDMDPHSIQLLSGSLSVRSPFLDAIREEEDEEPVFTKPSSYPSLGSGKYLHRLSGDSNGWGGRGSLSMIAEKQRHKTQEQPPPPPLQQQSAPDHQQTHFNNNSTNQSDSTKPRGPRPPVLLGRPRSNTSLTRVTTGFDIPSSASNLNGQDPQKELSTASKGDEASVLRQSQVSPESTMQDLEVKRVLEGAAALASFSSCSPPASPEASQSADTTPLPTSGSNHQQSTVSLSSSSRGITGQAAPSTAGDADPAVSFGQDTQKSIDDFFGMVKSDLDKRIQEAIQEVEQKFLDRVKRLEEQTATLAGAPPGMSLSLEDGGEGGVPKTGSLMESLTRPLPAHQNPGGSMALRKEILSHVTEKVGDLDLRVNQMEVLVSYKLVDIESKVQDLHGAHNTIAQKVHQVAKSHKSNMQGMRAGDGVGQDTINAEEIRIGEAMKPYRDMDAQGQGAGAFLERLSPDADEDKEGIVSLRGTVRTNAEASSTDLVDTSSSVVELRHELHDLGMRYQELNDGLLTDLMGQMRDAKLMLFQTVDEVDGRISKRVDRIEAEMHSKLLSEIEGRVQERVRAMEQTSSRLEKCFDKMEGRLGALETVLASKRPRPESMYQLLQQQLQQQQQHEEENGVLPYHAETFAGFSSSPSSGGGHRSITSMVFAEGEARPSESAAPPYSRPRRRTLAENGIYPDRTQPVRHDSISSEEPLMMLETASMHSTVKNNSSDNQYSTSHTALTASPLEGFVSQAHGRPVWSPARGVSSPQPSSFGSGANSLVSSPLERGTVIGSRMGTIHPEYTPKTSYVPSTPTRDKIHGASDKTSNGSRNRRVSLSSFDASSLSALKPVSRPTTAISADRPSSTSFVTTTTTTMTTMTAQHSNDNGHDKSSRRGSHGNLSVKTSSSSLLTAKLNEANSQSGGGSHSSSNNNYNSHSQSQSGSSTSSTPTRTMQRAMTFDTLHSQASSNSSVSRTVKSPVQGPSSYRDLLHFWKAGGSTSTPAQGTAV
ncbi:hypothetical protein BGZ75_002328 [Mortierella antarctica]|nr:hypothetical protein BGZ75_002328 [Mortierella antarctica]